MMLYKGDLIVFYKFSITTGSSSVLHFHSVIYLIILWSVWENQFQLLKQNVYVKKGKIRIKYLGYFVVTTIGIILNVFWNQLVAI